MDTAVRLESWEEAAQLYELRTRIGARLRWWHRVRLDRCRIGVNAYVELKPELDFIPEILGIRPRRVILSYLPNGRLGKFSVMIDGIASSQEWFSSADEAIERLIGLI